MSFFVFKCNHVRSIRYAMPASLFPPIHRHRRPPTVPGLPQARRPSTCNRTIPVTMILISALLLSLVMLVAWDSSDRR